MDGRLISFLQWHLYRIAERLGLIGKLAVIFFLVAIGAYVFLLRPLSHEVAAVKLASEVPTAAAVKSGLTEAEQFDAFERALPSVSARPS